MPTFFPFPRALVCIALVASSLSLAAAADPAPLFLQSFDLSNKVSDYVGTGPNQFDFIGSTGDAGNYSESVTGGDLVLSTVEHPPGGTGGQGFVRHTPYLGLHTALRIEFSLALNNKIGPPVQFASVEFGKDLPKEFVNNAGLQETRFLNLGFRKSSGRSLAVINSTLDTEESVELGAAALSGAMVRYQLLLNASAKPINITAPGDLGPKHLAPGSMSLFYNLGDSWTTAFDNVRAKNAPKSDLSQFRFSRGRIDVKTDERDIAVGDPCLAAWGELKITPLD